jgi:dTDP-4-amino-4,6-dideoxygalactose transaminase
VILCSNPLAQYRARCAEIDSAVHTVLESGRYILGEQVAQFEAEFAAYLGAGFAVGVGSGTDALHVALHVCGVRPGDEVITVSHTAVATVAAIALCGARPVLVDIDPAYYTMDPESLEAVITSRTRAIVPVHLYGQSVDLEPIIAVARHYGIPVIEDCAQAHGARYAGRRVGTWGDVACFSFYPTKNLGAIGDGGMVVTNDRSLAEQVRLVREYGWVDRYVSHVPGWNSRLDELQAAILRVKLRHLDEDNARRAQIAADYDRALAGASVTPPARRPGADHVYHLYVIRSRRRNELQAFLKDQGVGALVHYPVPVHLQPAYGNRVGGEGKSLPETERAAAEVISLPMYPELTEKEVRSVSERVIDFHAGRWKA